MSQISAYCLPDNGLLCLIPTNSCSQLVHLQTQKCPQGIKEVIPLRYRLPYLRPLNPAALLGPMVIYFGPPPLALQFPPSISVHLKVISRPVSPIPVLGDPPKHLNEPISLQMHHLSTWRNLRLTDGNIPFSIRMD